MIEKRFWLVVLLTLLTAFAVSAATKSKTELVRQAVSNDSKESSEAIKALRTLGREGLDTLFESYAAEIAQFTKTGETTDEWKRIAFALDSVAMQKDVYASRLFWFTDLEAAQKEAQKSGKTVLSLRLLGNLNEEFSCANSRFFRALLYSNSEISQNLRENYVLHWRSVRPAPKVTIDFGDGRKLERTLTGNSIHYILSSEGRVIEALPGLYSPAMFQKYLREAVGFNKMLNTANPIRRETMLLGFRKSQFDTIKLRRAQTIEETKVQLVEPKIESTKPLEIAPIATTKMISEATILRDLDDNFSRFEPQIPSEDWKKLSARYAADTKFDESSLAFIKRQNKNLSESELKSLLSNLTLYVGLDTTRNDFLYHTQLFQWLNQVRRDPFELEKFNSRVYSEIFRTPDADKWLGLYTTDVYTALDGNGVRF